MILAKSERLIAHLDMNSFFASVEQQARREFRGRPLGVCAYLGKQGCILAASIEAKKFGVKTGMTIAEAKRRVPSMAFVQADPTKYRAVIGKVFGLLHEMTDRVEHYSIDEAFMDLTGWYANELAVIQPFLNVKQRIKNEVGEWLKCSIGIAPTRVLAKMASDHQKPDGFTMISHSSTRAFLSERALTDVAGIGEKNRRKLQKLGVHTLIDFINYPSQNLIRLCGRDLYFLQMGLQGFDCQSIQGVPAETPKSVGHSYCLPRTVNQEGKVLPVFMKLVEKAGTRMRDLKRQAGSVTVTISFSEPKDPTAKNPAFFLRRFESDGTYRRFAEPTSDSFSLMEGAVGLLNQLWDGTREVSFLAITLNDLTPIRSQTSIDDQATKIITGDTMILAHGNKRERITTAMDHVRNRYGSEAIVFGPMSKLKGEAPDRIGFRKTDGVEVLQTA